MQAKISLNNFIIAFNFQSGDHALFKERIFWISALNNNRMYLLHSTNWC